MIIINAVPRTSLIPKLIIINTLLNQSVILVIITLIIGFLLNLLFHLNRLIRNNAKKHKGSVQER